MKRLTDWLRMKFEEIAKLLTGISCPVFGLQWSPTEADCVVARRMIRFLEDRRVLYVPYDVENRLLLHAIDSADSGDAHQRADEAERDGWSAVWFTPGDENGVPPVS